MYYYCSALAILSIFTYRPMCVCVCRLSVVSDLTENIKCAGSDGWLFV